MRLAADGPLDQGWDKVSDKVVLVNNDGEAIGVADKLAAHEQGLLHLAFSIMVFRDQQTGAEPSRQYLLQKRAATKYHGANLWSNTCCSHPHEGEALIAAAQRRIGEELGIFQPLQLHRLAPLYYRAEMPNGLIEHEFDHIFVCRDTILPFTANPDEVAEWEWVDSAELKRSLNTNPSRYTPWLPLVLDQIEQSGFK